MEDSDSIQTAHGSEKEQVAVKGYVAEHDQVIVIVALLELAHVAVDSVRPHCQRTSVDFEPEDC